MLSFNSLVLLCVMHINYPVFALLSLQKTFFCNFPIKFIVNTFETFGSAFDSFALIYGISYIFQVNQVMFSCSSFSLIQLYLFTAFILLHSLYSQALIARVFKVIQRLYFSLLHSVFLKLFSLFLSAVRFLDYQVAPILVAMLKRSLESSFGPCVHMFGHFLKTGNCGSDSDSDSDCVCGCGSGRGLCVFARRLLNANHAEIILRLSSSRCGLAWEQSHLKCGAD